jgi:hypothetical protein
MRSPTARRHRWRTIHACRGDAGTPRLYRSHDREERRIVASLARARQQTLAEGIGPATAFGFELLPILRAG